MADSIFSDKEVNVAKLKMNGLLNKEIADKLRVSEEDISQTLTRIRSKIKKVEDSIQLFEQLGIIKKENRFKMSAEGINIMNRSRMEKIQKLETPRIPIEEPPVNIMTLTRPRSYYTDSIEESYLFFKTNMDIYKKEQLQQLENIIGLDPVNTITSWGVYHAISGFAVKDFVVKSCNVASSFAERILESAPTPVVKHKPKG